MRELLVLAAVSACAEEPPPALAMTSNPIAVGAIARGHLDHLATASIDPPDLFSLAVTGDGLEVIPQAAGMATLTVATEDGFEITRVLRAVAIERVTATPTLRDSPCTDALFTLGTRASVAVELHGDGVELHGEIVPPVTASSGTIDTASSADGTLELRLPDSPNTVHLSSLVDSSLDVALEVVAPSTVDGLVLGEPQARLFPTSVATVPIDLRAGGRTLCGDTLSRTVTISTPDTCKLDGGALTASAAGLAELRVRGYHGGACIVHVTIAGTGLTATKTLVVSK